MAVKLHELLAAEGNLETQANQVRADLASTFEKKRHLFEEKRTVFNPSAEGATPVVESQSDIQSNVMKELKWISGTLSKAIDAGLQVAEANTRAFADVVLEDTDTILLSKIPATALLELEKRVTEWILNLVKTIPTLDPAKGFSPDPQRGNEIFKAREVNKTRTKKDVRVVVKYQATEQHPAQTELIPVDVPVGTIQEQEWSGLITPAQKSEMLERAEKLIRAIRRARSRANEAEVETRLRIGNKLMEFVIGK